MPLFVAAGIGTLLVLSYFHYVRATGRPRETR